MSRIRRTPSGDLAAKRLAMQAYFDHMLAKAGVASQLYGSGHRDEATTLCCCYIDGLANLLYADDVRSAFNFVRILREHGRQPEFARVRPIVMTRWLLANNKKLASARKLEAAMGTDLARIMSEGEFDAMMARHLTKQEYDTLCPERWRASLGFVAYLHLRIPAVHRTGPPGGVVVPSDVSSMAVRIDFHKLHGALSACISDLRQLSLTAGMWFGHDIIPM